MTTTPQLPVLYHQGKAGSIYSWRVWTEGPDIVTEYGQVDGEKQIARKTATPKNVGRSNATTAEEQATLEATAMHKKKMDHKYSLTVKEAQAERVLPMLAKSFDDRKNKLKYPVFTQPKLDGVRAFAYWNDDGQLEIISRKGENWRADGAIEHIARFLENLLPHNQAYDGEIYKHGATFQQNMRLVKKYRAGESEQLTLHVYDVITRTRLEDPFSARLNEVNNLEMLLTEENHPVQAVTTTLAENEEAVYNAQANYLAEGYEGAMVRTLNGPYKYGARSFDLLKVKNFLDAEFPIVGHKTGVGKFNGAVIWTIALPDGRTFDAVPRGTMEQRRQWHDTAKDYYGQMLNVRYFETSEDGIPRFPVGAGIRLPQDIS